MSPRHVIVWIGIYVSAGLAILGMIVFVVGMVIEFLGNRAQPLSESISPTVQLSLAGLCLFALMVVLGFLLVGLLLARQSYYYGAGYGEAYRLVENFQFARAIPLLERVLNSGKVTPDVLMLLTSAYAYNGNLAKAQATADRAVNMFPDDPGSYITLANGYRMQASYGEAALALQTATQLAPDQPIVWAELGFTQQLAGEHDSAIESFKRAALHPMPSMYSVRVSYHLSRHYKKIGDNDASNKAIERMLATGHGIQAWKATMKALQGTTYGSSLHYEVQNIEQAIAEASKSDYGARE